MSYIVDVEDAAAVDLQEDQHVQRPQHHRIDGEEVTGQDRAGMGGQELGPGRPGVLVRYGVLGEAWIPWQEIDQVVEERRLSPGGMDGLSTKDGVATFGVGGRTMLTIRRTRPGKVKGFLRGTPAIREIRVAAEDPDAFLVAITVAMPHRAS